MGGVSQRLMITVLSVFMSVLVVAVSTAAAAEPAAARRGPRHHAHFPRMQPAQQKLQSLMQEPYRARTGDFRASQAPGVFALPPACVPKYVTDMVIPPPMPVSVVPLRQVGACAGNVCVCVCVWGGGVVLQPMDTHHAKGGSPAPGGFVCWGGLWLGLGGGVSHRP